MRLKYVMILCGLEIWQVLYVHCQPFYILDSVKGIVEYTDDKTGYGYESCSVTKPCQLD